MRILIPTMVAVLAGAAGASAQTLTHAPLVLDLPGSTRALGLGDSYMVSSPDNDALFYNPALIDGGRGVGASAARYGGATTLLTMSAAADWWGGGVGFGLQAISYGAAGPAEGAFARGEAGLSDEGSAGASEYALTAAYARTIKGFRVGLGGKILEQRRLDEHASGVAFDAGVSRRISFVTLGLAARNFGPDPDLPGDLSLPYSVTLGASTASRPVGPLDVALAAAVSHRAEHAVVPSAGAEVSYYPVTGRTFTGRVGFRYFEDSDIQPLTLGAGFTGDRITIDYAWEGFDDAHGVHRLGVRWR
jgi:hypothetical protein